MVLTASDRLLPCWPEKTINLQVQLGDICIFYEAISRLVILKYKIYAFFVPLNYLKTFILIKVASEENTFKIKKEIEPLYPI